MARNNTKTQRSSIKKTEVNEDIKEEKNKRGRPLKSSKDKSNKVNNSPKTNITLLCQTLNQLGKKKARVLFTLEKENDLNWILVVHIIQVLKVKYPNIEFVLGVSEDFSYLKNFNIETINIKAKIRPGVFSVRFKLPTSEIDEFLEKNETFNLLNVLNNKYIGISRFMVSTPKFEFENLNQEYSDEVFFNLNEDDLSYKKIIKEIKKCSFEVIEFRDLTNKRIKKVVLDDDEDDINIDEEDDGIKLVPGYGSSVEILSNGFINYSSRFAITEDDKIEGKIIPSESVVLNYKNTLDEDDYTLDKGVTHKIKGSGVIEYEFVAEIGKKSIVIKLDLNEFKIKSGYSKSELEHSVFDEDDEEIIIDNKYNKNTQMELFIQKLKDCKYYIGQEDINFLIASMILGPENCILLDNDESEFNLIEMFPYFDMSNIIDITEYENGTIENKLEELHLKG